MTRTSRIFGRRDGVALIAVVGILGVLVLLAISFAVSMRTERLASEAAMADTVDRNVLMGAVNSAIAEINDVFANGDPTQPAAVKRPVMAYAPRDLRILASVSTAASPTQVGASAKLLEGLVADWIPLRYFTPGSTYFDGEDAAAKADWIDVASADGRVVGRYAWVAFDCSGMLDANMVGDVGSTRNDGTQIDQIDAASLPGVTDSANLTANRSNFRQFFTPAEVIELNDGAGTNEQAAINANRLTDLTCYSWNYDAGYFDWSAGHWRPMGIYGSPVPGDVRAWSQADAQQVFSMINLPAETANSFVDYVDADSTPLNGPDAYCAEAIPMINEIDIASKVEANPANTNEARHVIRFQVEVWYPFPGVANGRTYRVRLQSPPVLPATVVVQVNGSANATFVPSQPVIPPDAPVVANPAAPFNVVDFEWRTPYVTIPSPFNTLGVILRDVRVEIVDDSGNVVDRTLTQQVTPLRVLPGAPSAVYRPAQFSSQVNDPRLNHSSAEWMVATRSSGALNSGVTGFNVSQANGYTEGTSLYVRNSPQLKSVAELGYIGTGQRWSSIDLFATSGVFLLEHFRTESSAAYTNHAGLPQQRKWMPGKINPGVASTSVLYAAFVNAPLQRDGPDQLPATAPKLSSAMASNLADHVASNAMDRTRSGEAGFDSWADWTQANIFTNPALRSVLRDPSDLTKDMNNVDRESIVRNTYRMFGVGQQLFVLVVVARAVQDLDPAGVGGGDFVTGEKRAVALVWRDPFPDNSADGQPRYAISIRAIRYLDD